MAGQHISYHFFRLMHFVKLNFGGDESAYLHFAVQFFHDTPQASKQPPPSPLRWQLDARCKIIPPSIPLGIARADLYP